VGGFAFRMRYIPPSSGNGATRGVADQGKCATAENNLIMMKVWIVEDNAHFRNAVGRLINDSEGIQCEEFASSEELLEQFDRSSAPDVLLLDIRLPGMSGIEAIPAIKERAPDTQIVMLTSFLDSENIFQALRAGASGYLLKTSTEVEIIESIHQVARGGVPMTPLIARSVLAYFKKLTAVRQDYNLSSREVEILRLMIEGLIKKEIADRLSLSFHTVDDYLRNIYRKLHVNSGTAAVAKAVRERLC
jgi:DNA-binding NarL/FixJ family response regulator